MLSLLMSLVFLKDWYLNDYIVYVFKDDIGNVFDSYINVVIDISWWNDFCVKGVDDFSIDWKIIFGGFFRVFFYLVSVGMYYVYYKNLLVNFLVVLYGMVFLKLFFFLVGMKWL